MPVLVRSRRRRAAPTATAVASGLAPPTAPGRASGVDGRGAVVASSAAAAPSRRPRRSAAAHSASVSAGRWGRGGDRRVDPRPRAPRTPSPSASARAAELGVVEPVADLVLRQGEVAGRRRAVRGDERVRPAGERAERAEPDDPRARPGRRVVEQRRARSPGAAAERRRRRWRAAPRAPTARRCRPPGSPSRATAGDSPSSLERRPSSCARSPVAGPRTAPASGRR